MPNINSVTKSSVSKYGVFGYPVSQSLSPVMQNSAFSKAGLPAVYQAFEVKPEELESSILKAQADGFMGLNLTIPHKEAVLKFDFLNPDSFSKMAGAVNTLRFSNGFIEGFNTDAGGAMLALEYEEIHPAGKKILVIGAGGASRSLSFLFSKIASELKIINRTAERAEKLAADIFSHLPEDLQNKKISGGGFADILNDISNADIILQTTELGMGVYESFSVFDQIPNFCSGEERAVLLKKYLTSDKVVFDIVYHPKETKFLKESRAAGAKTINGMMMLVFQGALAFEIWTGQKSDISVMRQAVLEALDNNQSITTNR
ncbi:shikimate dehydrogenase [Methanolapillus ohkumae]|uniref:Shikimate dehydrogenase (NADP(+)) n=1 Tax=Methanolapillus ohkumae TaxID=3028298 RepID=A0AA96VJS4_9EURY|nr:Shikimate dehydrogenase (NADP(+)) [Methanosarcinaceae archaeon Am2]